MTTKKTSEGNVNNLPVHKSMFENIEDSCDIIDGVQMNWEAKDCGFGQFYFYHNDEGQLCCDSETMGKEFIKRMLCQMVDDCELT